MDQLLKIVGTVAAVQLCRRRERHPQTLPSVVGKSRPSSSGTRSHGDLRNVS